MATETQKPTLTKPEPGNPKKTLTLITPNPLDLNLETPKSDDTPDSAIGNGDGNSSDNKDGSGDESKGATIVVSPTGGSENDIQRKMKRAERFGVPVQLSEEEKRNSRAERFGTATGSEAHKTSEDQKRKARAERFGISVPADEEAKKKARLEKFGANIKVDTVEEEKRKARALRFSQASGTAAAHINGNKDSGSGTLVEGHDN